MDLIHNLDESLRTKMSERETIDMNRSNEDMKRSRSSGDFCDNCEMSDRNVSKRRKTRRGRRKPYQISKKNIDVLDNIYQSSSSSQHQLEVMPRGGPGNRGKMLRTPVSPKAPQNSTQFLIEDRYDYMSLNDLGYLGVQSPEQTLSNVPGSPDQDTSFYNETRGKMERKEDSICSDDTEYLQLDETYDFIGREFEREFAESQYSHEMDTRLSLKTRLLNENTKQEIIEKFFQLEIRLKEVFDEDISSQSTKFCKRKSDLMSEIKQLQKENSSLKEENELLKSLTS